jgi:F0F1-type ATP synthase assembly protein I
MEMGRGSGPRDRSPEVGAGRPAGEAPSRGSQVGPYVTAGFQFAAVLLVFTGLGYFLDGRLHTLPLLTFTGAALGGVGGFMHLYRSLTGSRRGETRPR